MAAIGRGSTLRFPRSSVPDAVSTRKRVLRMSTFLWIVLVAIYLTALISLGAMTLRKGHTLLFIVGIIFPILWVVGAVMAPTRRAPGVA
jgi:hypothetical protein